MHTHYKIRAEKCDDAEQIHAVHLASFPTNGEAKLVDALRATNCLPVSIVACIEDKIIGHAAFSPVTAGDSTGIGLGPIAVIQSQRRLGIGARLIEDGLSKCRELGYAWIVVLGDPKYYARFGFRPASEFGLQDEFRGGSHFQAMELAKGQLPIGSRLVKYSPEFMKLG